jgi:hypothetical protein
MVTWLPHRRNHNGKGPLGGVGYRHYLLRCPVTLRFPSSHAERDLAVDRTAAFRRSPLIPMHRGEGPLSTHPSHSNPAVKIDRSRPIGDIRCDPPRWKVVPPFQLSDLARISTYLAPHRSPSDQPPVPMVSCRLRQRFALAQARSKARSWLRNPGASGESGLKVGDIS